MDEETRQITVEEVKIETHKAILCVLEGGEELWVPKSVIHDESEVQGQGDEGCLVVAAWFAKKEGWD